jgi:hypothetical protein
MNELNKLEPLQTYVPGHGGMYTITSGQGTYIKLADAQAREAVLVKALRKYKCVRDGFGVVTADAILALIDAEKGGAK